jgi:Domain of unknown function (DUF4402)
MRIMIAAMALAAISLEDARAERVQASGSAKATVIEPIAVRPLQDLDFGTIALTGRSAGTVVLAPGQSSAHYTGGVHPVCGSGCAGPRSARFEVRGEAGRSYVITVPDVASETGQNESQQLRLVAIRAKTASRAGLGTVGELNIFGLDHFDLGGTLQVPAELAPAHYRLNLPVIMAYN